MKLLHISDLHIGKTMHACSMLEDQKYILEQIISAADKEQVDGVLIAGDVYNRSIPTTEAVALLDWFLTSLLKENSRGKNNKKREVFLISGNHDSPERICFGEKLLEKRGLHIAGTLTKEVKKIVYKDEYGRVNFYLLPFAHPRTMKYVLEQDELENSYHSCVEAFTDKMKLNVSERNVLVTHHFVVGNGEVPLLSESENFISVGGIAAVDAGIWKDFDYVALGHLHRPQRVGKDTIRYAGSPLKYSFSEAFDEKSMTIAELREKGEVSVRTIPLVPLHDMRILKGKLSELLQKDVVRAGNPEDYMQITLTDKEELFEPLEKLRAVYPNVLQLIFEKNLKTEQEAFHACALTAKKTTKELFLEFYEAVEGETLSDKQLELVTQLSEEIGGEDATS